MSQGLHCMVEVVITTVDINGKSLCRAKPPTLRLLAARAERFDQVTSTLEDSHKVRRRARGPRQMEISKSL